MGLATSVGPKVVFVANQDHVLALRVTSTASTVLGNGQNLVEVSHAHYHIGLFAWFSRHNF